jgi:hypothetical protein
MSSDNSDDKLIENVTKGAVKGFLEFSKEELASFIKKFRDKKLAFIGEEKTIETAKEQYKSGESKFYHSYIKNKELLFLVGMGLTLRKIENDSDKRTNLRTKILHKFKVKGLHIAEFVQNGILNRYIAILLELIDSIDDLENQIEEVLKNIEKHSLFVRNLDRLGEIIRKSINITDTYNPQIFVISGEGPCANIIRDSITKIAESLKNYSYERISTLGRECLFFKLKQD